MATKPEDGLASMFANLEKATGKTLEEWILIARETGVSKHRELTALLKSEYSLSHGYANQIALRALAPVGAPEVGSVDLIEVQYSGAKSAMRPLYDKLKSILESLGEDVEFSPKKAYVSVRRNKQFAMIQPTTATRADLGLILKDQPADGKLELSGSFNAMFTHRIRLGSVDEIDEVVASWLKKAYEGA